MVRAEEVLDAVVESHGKVTDCVLLEEDSVTVGGCLRLFVVKLVVVHVPLVCWSKLDLVLIIAGVFRSHLLVQGRAIRQ